MKKRIAILLSLFIIVPFLQASESDNMLMRMEKIDKFVSNAPIFISTYSLKNLRKIGSLKKETSEKHPNPHVPSKTLEYINLEYEGLEIAGVIIEEGSDHVTPIRITLSSPQWNVLYGLNVGTQILKIKEILGTPTDKGPNFLEYCGETDCVIFSHDKGKITAIQLNYYVD